MLTEREIKAALMRHAARGEPPFCANACYEDWPCDAHKALTDLLAVRVFMGSVEGVSDAK